MDINGREKAKRFWIVASLLGICMFVTAIFCFFHTEKNEAEKRMVEIVNYVKVQCSTYTHYNESSESKSLLRAIESARQMSTNIDMEVWKHCRDYLHQSCLQRLDVNGVLSIVTLIIQRERVWTVKSGRRLLNVWSNSFRIQG